MYRMVFLIMIALSSQAWCAEYPQGETQIKIYKAVYMASRSLVDKAVAECNKLGHLPNVIQHTTPILRYNSPATEGGVKYNAPLRSWTFTCAKFEGS